MSGVTRRAVLAHRVALRAARPFLRPRAVPATGRPRVTILAMNAYAMGGATRAVLTLAGHLAQTCDVEVLTLWGTRRGPAFRFPPGVRVTSIVAGRPGPRSRWRLLRAVLSRGRGRLLHPAVRRAQQTTLWTDLKLVLALRRVRGGLVVGTAPPLNIIVAQLTRPGVATAGQEHLFYRFRKPALQAALRRWAPELGALVVLTERDRRDYAAALGPGARVECIPTAVPPIGGPPSDLSAPVVLAAGRLTWQKGFERLVRGFAPVAAQEPDWRLRIAGHGPRRPRLAEIIAEEGLEDRVELLGRVSDIGAEMAGASVFALSSRWEGYPLVLIEAMSKGLPVVSFDCPTGPAEIVVDGETGYLVPDGDMRAFVDRLLDLIRDEDKRRRFGAAAARRAQDYAIDRIGPRWDALVADLMARAGAAPAGGRPAGQAAAGANP